MPQIRIAQKIVQLGMVENRFRAARFITVATYPLRIASSISNVNGSSRPQSGQEACEGYHPDDHSFPEAPSTFCLCHVMRGARVFGGIDCTMLNCGSKTAVVLKFKRESALLN